jgi:ribosome recycling factor
MQNEVRDKMQSTINHLHEQLKTVRTGRANAAMVENITVVYYDQHMPIKALANITTPDATTITIAPWDPNSVEPIEKALRDNPDVDLTPVSDGKTIHINVPTPTEDRREQLVKQVSSLAEDAHVALRNVRHEALKKYQNQLKQKQISQDEFDRAKKQLDELVQEFGNSVDRASEDKKQEVQTV